MEAVARAPLRAEREIEPKAWRGYVPALPTLWPSMWLGGGQAPSFFPFDAPHARAFYFARNAVWMATKVLGLDGREVLVPAYHHGVEVEALIDAGAQVRFFRVDDRMRPDLTDLERKITKNTRGIYLIHYAGFPGPARKVRELADRHGLAFIEDCALALLSAEGTAPLGRLGDASIFCLYKTLPVPHGGVLVLGNERPAGLPEPSAPPVAATVRHALSSMLMNLELRAGAPGRWLRGAVRSVGRAASGAAGLSNVATGTQHFNRDHSGLGMSPLALRLACSQNARDIVATRRRNYFQLLSQLRELSPPVFATLPAGTCPLFYPLRTNSPEAIAEKLAERGIETVQFWRGGHPTCDLREFPEVAEMRRTILEIPIHQDISPTSAAGIAGAVRDALAEVER